MWKSEGVARLKTGDRWGLVVTGDESTRKVRVTQLVLYSTDVRTN